MDFIQALDPSKLVFAGTVFILLLVLSNEVTSNRLGFVFSYKSVHSALVQFARFPLWYICARKHRKHPGSSNSEALKFPSYLLL